MAKECLMIIRDTKTPLQGRQLLSLDLERQLDQICNRFEAEWKAGEQPRIDDFLNDWPHERRTHLFHELISLDIHYRSSHGGQPNAEEYQRRFPWLDPAWLAAALMRRDSSDASSTIAYNPVIPQVRSGKYSIKKFHARGGMGEVWVA